MHHVTSLADLGSLSGAQLASAVAGPDHPGPAKVPMAVPAEAPTAVPTANAAAFPGKGGAPLGRGGQLAAVTCGWMRPLARIIRRED